jgi:transposase
MPEAYSYDFRAKAISAFKRGERKTEVCQMFGISRNTLDLWLKREQETGDFRARAKGKARGELKKIKDIDKFREFVRLNGEKTQQQLAELWGDNLTQQNISDALNQLGITRKKKLTGIGKEMKKNAVNSLGD